jgi:DNA processing protein
MILLNTNNYFIMNIHALLRLSSVQRIGPQKIRALISRFETPEKVLKASARELIGVPGIDKKLALNILHHTNGEKFADDQLKRLNIVGGRIISVWDREYPDLLRKIYDPPAFLFVLGKFKEFDMRAIALVGTRHPTPYGHSVAENLTRDLAKQSITIVSGLARGVDTIVHSNSLKYKTRTIAVIGSGLDVPYPPENKKLLDHIAEEGAVVSEFPMGTKPDASNFPRRNRIISGLTLGTVVIESAEDGGALITATTALDQDREVFAVPGNITEKRSAGSNKLIRDGRAKLITCVDDIFAELRIQLRLSLGEPTQKPVNELTSTERVIFNLLSTEPIHIDTLAEKANSSTSNVLVTLLSLEFKGMVCQLPGKMFIRY